MLFSIDATEALRSRLGEAGIKLDTDFDAVSELWTYRPALPDAPIFVHDVKYAGEEPSSKIAAILAETSRCGANAIFISDLAEIAWTLNIRSRDVESNPVAISFLYLSETGSTLFVDPRKVTPEVIAHLDSCGIATQPYDRTLPFLAALPDTARVLVSPSQTMRRCRLRTRQKPHSAPRLACRHPQRMQKRNSDRRHPPGHAPRRSRPRQGIHAYRGRRRRTAAPHRDGHCRPAHTLPFAATALFRPEFRHHRRIRPPTER